MENTNNNQHSLTLWEELKYREFLYQCTNEKTVKQKLDNNETITIYIGIETFGYTAPLVTKSDGTKMGKTKTGAIYCDKKITSVFDFYQ